MPEPAPPGAASLLRQLQDLLQDLPGLVGDRVELLLLELQRAARALVQIVALGVAAAILGVTAWLLLWAGAIRLLMLAGLSMDGALLVALAVNGLALGVALQRLRRLLPELSLPATRRHLLPPGDPDEPD
ncbi:MAG: phage holin family protein [Methylotenera sp.]|nr:phage holin family protein [Methylotenera sp.]